MSKRIRKAPIPMAMTKHRLPKTEKVRIDDLSTVAISQKGKDFIKFCEANNVDFTAFFVAFNVWMQVPGREKEAVILQLIKDGKVDLGDDVRKSDQGQ